MTNHVTVFGCRISLLSQFNSEYSLISEFGFVCSSKLYQKGTCHSPTRTRRSFLTPKNLSLITASTLIKSNASDHLLTVAAEVSWPFEARIGAVRPNIEFEWALNPLEHRQADSLTVLWSTCLIELCNSDLHFVDGGMTITDINKHI